MKMRWTAVIVVSIVMTGSGIVGCQQPARSATGSPRAAATGSGSRVSWTGTQTVQVNDPRFGMPAATMEIPAGWSFVGMVARPAGCHAPPMAWLSTTAVAQDGVTAIIGLPSVSWNWTSSKAMSKSVAAMHCPGVNIKTAADFLVNIALPNLEPNAKVVAILPAEPAVQAAIQKQMAGSSPRHTMDSARLHIAYTRGGRPVEEMISAVVDCTESTGVALFGSGEPPPVNRSCHTNGTNIVRAPQGRLDETLAAMQQPHFQDLTKTWHPETPWFMKAMRDQQAGFDAATAQFNKAAAGIRAEGQAAEDRLVANAQAQRQQMERSTASAMAADQARQGAIDGAAHNTVNYSLDRKDYINPSTGQTINASSEYNHQWMSSDGSTLIQTNDHSYDPNGAVYPVSQSWLELVPK